MRQYTLLALGLALLLAACNGGGDEKAIQDTVQDFFQTLGEDSNEAYLLLAEECRNEISLDDFKDSTGELTTFFSGSEVRVVNVEITERLDDEIVANLDINIVTEGEDAPLGDGGLGQARFRKEEGRWRFADCENFGAGEEIPEAGPAPTPFVLTRASAELAEADDDPTLPGEYVDLPGIYGGPYPDTAKHTRQDVDYVGDGNTNPPAGGPHWGSGACPVDPDEAPPLCGPVRWGIYRKPWEPETLVHNMEHGGVVLWYNIGDQTIVDQLEDLIRNRLERGQQLVMAPYPDMEEEHIALTAWSRIDKFPVADYTRERVEEFIDAHDRRFNPEAF
jgi:hypothetical protein